MLFTTLLFFTLFPTEAHVEVIKDTFGKSVLHSLTQNIIFFSLLTHQSLATKIETRENKRRRSFETGEKIFS